MIKEGYFALGCVLLFQLWRVGYFYYKRRQVKQVDSDMADYRWETYLEVREQILSTKPIDLGIDLPDDNETAYAVGLEMHRGVEVKIIVLSHKNEIWALTTNNARKNIFIPKNENFLPAAISVLATAQYHFARMRRKYISVPEPRHIKFYIFTNNDVYSADSPIRDIISQTSDWQELYVKLIEALEQSG